MKARKVNKEEWTFIAVAIITLLIAAAVGIHYFQNL
jgi:hypothetical protein